MKKHLSVLMLAVRSSIYKVLLLALATGAVQAGLFWAAKEKTGMTEAAQDMLRTVNLETVLESSHIYLAAGIGFYLLCVILCMTGCGFGSKVGYTLRRLAVKERTTTLWWAAYNTCCFGIFWMSQILVMVLLCRWYGMEAADGTFGPQSVFLAFYRDGYLHSLMPMAEVSRWVRNIILCVCLGLCTATFSYQLRRGKKGVAIFLLAAGTFGTFCLEMVNLAADIAVSVGALIVAGVSAVLIWEIEGETDEN